jgi:hypothetical protein
MQAVLDFLKMFLIVKTQCAIFHHIKGNRMSKKFGTIIDEDVLTRARAYCRTHHMTISHVVEAALADYLKRDTTSHDTLSRVEASFGALSIPPDVLETILAEDLYDAA